MNTKKIYNTIMYKRNIYLTCLICCVCLSLCGCKAEKNSQPKLSDTDNKAEEATPTVTPNEGLCISLSTFNTTLSTKYFDVPFDRSKLSYTHSKDSDVFTVKEVDTDKYPNTYLSISTTADYNLEDTVAGLIQQSGYDGIQEDVTIGKEKLSAKCFRYQEGKKPASRICEYYVLDKGEERVIIELAYYIKSTETHGARLHSMLNSMTLTTFESENNTADHSSHDTPILDSSIHAAYIKNLPNVCFEAEHNFMTTSKLSTTQNITPGVSLWCDLPLKSLSLVRISYHDDSFIKESTLFTATDVKELESFIIYEPIVDASIPNLALIAEDANGNIQTYAITESGFDGSILVSKETVLY